MTFVGNGKYYVGVVPPYKVVVGERPWENAEDDLWYDAPSRPKLRWSCGCCGEPLPVDSIGQTRGDHHVCPQRCQCGMRPPRELPRLADLDAIWASVDATMPDLSHLKGWTADRDQQAHMGVEFD